MIFFTTFTIHSMGTLQGALLLYFPTQPISILLRIFVTRSPTSIKICKIFDIAELVITG